MSNNIFLNAPIFAESFYNPFIISGNCSVYFDANKQLIEESRRENSVGK